MAAALGGSTGQDYWSLDDILAGQERVPCKVEQPLYRLGFLTSSSGDQHLQPGTKIEIPVWLVKSLCTRKRKIVSLSYSKAYRQPMRTALSADASAINLHRNGPYFYSCGVKLLNFDLPERAELSQCLLETFIQRFRRLMDESHNAYQMDVSQFTSTLDQMEKYLFSIGQKRLMEQVRWESGNDKQIQKSSLIETSSRKRKRDT